VTAYQKKLLGTTSIWFSDYGCTILRWWKSLDQNHELDVAKMLLILIICIHKDMYIEHRISTNLFSVLNIIYQRCTMWRADRSLNSEADRISPNRSFVSFNTFYIKNKQKRNQFLYFGVHLRVVYNLESGRVRQSLTSQLTTSSDVRNAELTNSSFEGININTLVTTPKVPSPPALLSEHEWYTYKYYKHYK